MMGVVFGRKKSSTPDPVDSDAVAAEDSMEAAQQQKKGYTPPKGAPTPSRKEQEKARHRPLIADDRKVAKAEHRAAVAEERAKMRHALDTGEEKYLPARDQGQQRRYARDYVDARTGIGEWLMVVMLVLLALAFIQNPTTQWIVMYGMLAMIFLVVAEGFYIGAQVKKRLEAKFGVMEPGTRWYAAMRGMQMRRMRLPKPQVKRGEFPE